MYDASIRPVTTPSRETNNQRGFIRLATFGLLLGVAACGSVEEYEAESYDAEDGVLLDDKALPPPITYQAESNTARSGCSVATNHAGYTGSGFVDFITDGGWMEWNNVSAPQAGRYELRFRYANAGSSDRAGTISVNGKNVGTLSFSPTGTWTQWSTTSLSVSLARGNNAIRVLANTGGPNLDRVDVVATDLCPSDSSKVEPGQCGCGVPEGSCGSSGTCSLVNEQSTATIACGAGATIKAIAFASYGKPTGSCSTGFALSSCHAATSQQVLSACVGKQSCSVAASNSVFGDPCPGASKQLAVSYSCSSSPIDNCPNDPNKTQPGLCGCGKPEGSCGGVSLNRIDGNELRIADYNVMRSSVFPLDNGSPGKTGTAARIAGFKRIAKAVNADIWAMQEVMYDGNDQPGRTPAGLKRYMESITGRTLYMAHHDNYQEFVFSRYPIDASGSVGHRTVWALIDVGNDNNRQNDVAIISVHFVTDGGGTDVANLVSSILAGRHTIPRDVTLVVAGDFNNQPNGVRYAAVKSAIGVSDVRPIWLGTTNTAFTHGGLTYTNGAFKVPSGGSPIDYVFARTNSSYAVAKNYILGTLALNQNVLDAHGLQRMDTALDPGQSVSEGVSVNCDHLPLVVDLRLVR